MNAQFISRKACPICHKEPAKTLIEIPYASTEMQDYLSSFYDNRVDATSLYDVNFVVQECMSCNSLYQKHIPDSRLSTVLYEDWVDPTSTSIEKISNYDIEHYEFNASEIRQLFSLYDLPSGKLNVLDYGMGWGSWAKMCSAYGAKTYGYDFSEKRNVHATKHGFNIINLTEITNKKFDLINTEQVFEHIPDPLETIQLLAESLTEGGVIKISVPHAFNFKARLKKIDWKTKNKFSNQSINPVAPLEHLNFFTRKAIVGMGEQAGLREIKIPLNKQYALSSNFFTSPKSCIKFLFRLIMRNYFINYVLLQKP